MLCRIEDLREKEVINISDGVKLGYVYDAEIDTKNAYLTSLVIYTKPKFFGIFGKSEDLVVSWKDISLIGDDTILVTHEVSPKKKRKTGLLSNFFEMK